MRFRGRGDQRLPELEKRRQATQRTLGRFRHKPFDWSTGITCVHLARYHLRQMGHRPPGMPRFRSAYAARKALLEREWETVSDMLDSLLTRIPPAAMLVGDLAVVPGGDGLESIMICTGPQLLLGWLPNGEEMAVYQGGIEDVTGAWRA